MTVKEKDIISDKSQFYYDQALSWLSFNHRVLHESLDKDLPVFEKIKFLAFHQSNLDKFFRTAVSTYKILYKLSKKHLIKLDFSPKETLKSIYSEINHQEAEFESILENAIINELALNNIQLAQKLELNEEQVEFVRQYFIDEILPFLHPIIINKGELLNFFQENTIYLAIVLQKRKIIIEEEIISNQKFTYGLVNIPTEKLTRFLVLPDCGQKKTIIFLDDIIKLHLDILFPVYKILSSHSFILIRNGRLKIEDEINRRYTKEIHEILVHGKKGLPARFQYDRNLPQKFVQILRKELKLSKKDMMAAYKYQNLADLISFPNPFKPLLESKAFTPLHLYNVDKSSSILDAIKEKDFLIHFPYHPFDYVIRFFNEAAIDPKVSEIKTTQYKLEYNSAIVGPLISAAMNGKKVSIYVDFKAQFDESSNLSLIERMSAAGIHVIPSISGNKIHAKAALVIRRKSAKDSHLKGFAYFSTGNFNKKNSKIYSDIGLFTANIEMIDDLNKYFKFLEKPQLNISLKHLIIPKFKYFQIFKLLIENEITHAKSGKNAHIILKINNLGDKKIIDLLYEASKNGVKINIIVRGVCSIVPGKNFSENIKVIRIVDKFLEHSRIFYFHNNGKNSIYLSTTDLMKQDLIKRLDLFVPILNDNIKTELLSILKFYLDDNVKALILGNNINDWYKPKITDNRINAQSEIYQFLLALHQ